LAPANEDMLAKAKAAAEEAKAKALAAAEQAKAAAERAKADALAAADQAKTGALAPANKTESTTESAVQAPPAQEMTPMVFEVPAGMCGGQTMQVQTPSGMMSVMVPVGLTAGQQFTLQVPSTMSMSPPAATGPVVTAPTQAATTPSAQAVTRSVTSPVGKAMATAKHYATKEELPPVAVRLAAGHVVFSRSATSDLWLYLKNSHIILSLFFAHPRHPFSAVERRVCLVCSVLLGVGLTCLFNLVDAETDRMIIALVVGSLVQGIYDALLKTLASCMCVSGQARGVVFCAKACGRVGLFWQFFIALILCIVGVVVLFGKNDSKRLGDTAWEFSTSKGMSWFASSIAISTVLFIVARMGQMKPTTDKKLAKWNAPGAPKKCLPGKNKPKNHLWNTHIGADVDYKGLPATAPSYRVKFCCCCEWGRDPTSQDDPASPVQTV